MERTLHGAQRVCRNGEKTQNGIETEVRTYQDDIPISRNGEKTQNGIETFYVKLAPDSLLSRNGEKTQNGIETCLKMSGEAIEQKSQRRENPERD